MVDIFIIRRIYTLRVYKNSKNFAKQSFSYILGDLEQSFSHGNAHASMAVCSLNHDLITHEALGVSFTLKRSFLGETIVEMGSV